MDVAIIGCGVSGLTSIKTCRDVGLNPVCFEQQSSLGGVWNLYTDDPRPNLSSVHKCTITNTSKLFTAFSDFPFPKEFPNYLPQNLVQKYVELYAKEFDLAKYVQFNTEVVKLERSADHSETGKWIVSTRLKEDNSEIKTTLFDAVMICNGHYSHQVWPNIPGMEKFKGIKVHSGDYRTFYPFVGKRVVIVGCSHSAVDIAVELSHDHAKQVYISTRSGCYLVTRLGPGGQPADFFITRVASLLPMKYLRKLSPVLLNNKVNFKNIGLHPSGTFGVNQTAVVNDQLLHRIITGHIIIKGDIKEIAEDSVILHGGETLEKIDALVVATGFKPIYPFAKEIIEVKEEFYTSLYKHVFLPDDDRHTLAVIGAVGVGGPVPPVSEMQARVAVEVFLKRCKLLSKEDMETEIANRERAWSKTGASKYYFMRVPYVPYMNELGEMIGAKPNLWSIFKNDPKLAYQCIFGTTVAAQYRLQGPNVWPGARNHIMTFKEQYLYPLRTRKSSPSEEKRSYGVLVFIIVVGLAIVAVMLKA
ncbi:dimethylaniline monooxygenase [N-oxide-forming] 5-like isoform X2 [Dendronephthya gigantea]|uniref:dimethylaniline monooxygenase [N-oxide-forming] 5-like isoform X2 n=1 Tax=Dendronephthya gigantea TaxID=151771 RepID=UPI00106B5A54|nr:dimethylaniline monooxygenase [N-oxide-forming] 5-like isoform X2 [Dendronephthya gigantea]